MPVMLVQFRRGVVALHFSSDSQLGAKFIGFHLVLRDCPESVRYNRAATRDPRFSNLLVPQVARSLLPNMKAGLQLSGCTVYA